MSGIFLVIHLIKSWDYIKTSPTLCGILKLPFFVIFTSIALIVISAREGSSSGTLESSNLMCVFPNKPNK